MDIYCLRCRRKTKNLSIDPVITKNKRHAIKAVCSVCKSNKSKFVSKRKIEGSGFLTNLSNKLFQIIPILNKII